MLRAPTTPLAVRYASARTLTTGPAETGPPGPGQVELAPAFVGICGTDLHIFHGDMDARVKAPAVIGHEMSGRVVRVGAGVEGYAAGDPVTVMPVSWDGTCPACCRGHRHVCQSLDFIGIDSPGAMQQRWTVPAAALVRLPESLPLDRAALVEPTAVAVHDVRRAGVRPGDRVTVFGGGPVSVLIALVAKAVGGDVRVVEPDAHRRRLADQLGLSTGDPGADTGADIAFGASGAEAGRELTPISAQLYDREDFETAVRLIDEGTIPAGKLISRVVPLADALGAFQSLEAGGDVKVLVDCGASFSLSAA